MHLLPSKMVPFSIVEIAFSCGRVKTIQKRNVWTQNFLKTEKKSPFSNKNGSVWTGPKSISRVSWSLQIFELLKRIHCNKKTHTQTAASFLMRR